MLGVTAEVQLSDGQQVGLQPSCQSRIHWLTDNRNFRAMEDDNNIGLRLVLKMEMLAIRIDCSLVLVTVIFQLKFSFY